MDIQLWKKRRKDLKLNYEELSKLSGVSKRTIEDIFRGFTVAPRIDTVEAIEKALGLNQQSGWTEEEIAAGVGRYATYLTEKETEWLELRSEIIQVHGEQYLENLIITLKALTKKA